jgi:hypothetical protein
VAAAGPVQRQENNNCAGRVADTRQDASVLLGLQRKIMFGATNPACAAFRPIAADAGCVKGYYAGMAGHRLMLCDACSPARRFAELAGVSCKRFSAALHCGGRGLVSGHVHNFKFPQSGCGSTGS